MLALGVGAVNAQRWVVHTQRIDELTEEARREAATLQDVKFDADGRAVDRDGYRDAMMRVEMSQSRLEHNQRFVEMRRNYSLGSLLVFLLTAGLAVRASRQTKLELQEAAS